MPPVQNNILATTASADNLSRVSPTDEIPTNCHTIIIFNPDSTNSVYFAEGTASAVVLPSTSSTILAPNSAITLSIGVLTTRGNPYAQLVYSTSAGTIAVNITYICTNIQW